MVCAGSASTLNTTRVIYSMLGHHSILGKGLRWPRWLAWWFQVSTVATIDEQDSRRNKQVLHCDLVDKTTVFFDPDIPQSTRGLEVASSLGTPG